MGGGSYSSVSRSTRATDSGFYTKSSQQIFTERSINNAMNPHGLSVRESRDSEEHPNSIAIIVALDVTGSMGSIPHQLVKEGLPHMMQNILDAGVHDPQVLFLGIGDHECDNAPLQVGQFESSDELMDKWLTTVYLEGGGGGNDGESYLLAWYLASKHTEIDCLEKRGKKGILFTIGDEPTLKELPASTLKSLMGDGQYSDMSLHELLDMVRESYHTFHIHVKETSSGSRQRVIDGWKQLLGDDLLEVQSKTIIPEVIAAKVAEICKNQSDVKVVEKVELTEVNLVEPKQEELML